MGKYGKKHGNPLGNFCSMLLIMHGIDSYSARSKSHITIKTSYVRLFTVPLILEVWLPDYYHYPIHCFSPQEGKNFQESVVAKAFLC